MRPISTHSNCKEASKTLQYYLEGIEVLCQKHGCLALSPALVSYFKTGTAVTDDKVGQLYGAWRDGRTRIFKFSEDITGDQDAQFTFARKVIEAGAYQLMYTIELRASSDTGKTVQAIDYVQVMVADAREEWQAMGPLREGEILEWSIQPSNHFRDHFVVQNVITNDTVVVSEDEEVEFLAGVLEAELGSTIPEPIRTEMAVELRRRVHEDSTEIEIGQDAKRKLVTNSRLATKPQAIIEKMKVGRNDACPCGSGKKFKRCCMGVN